MALVIWLEKRKFDSNVKKLFEDAANGNCEILIPPLVFAEIGYLFEKKRISISLTDVKNYLQKFSSFKSAPVSIDTFINAFKITDIPELHDRLISGTALTLELDLITNDPVIINSKFVNTISF